MKLHELLAVETNRQTQTNKVRADLAKTFESKRHLFEKVEIRFTPNTEGAQVVTEQQSDLQTTVTKELEWLQPHIAQALDLEYQIAETNMSARADVILENGTILLTGVPATSLLELQKRMGELLDLAKAIPTLDPAKGFQPDTAAGAGIYQARLVRKDRTKKVPKVFVRYEATKEHPAQTEMVHEDVVTGTIEQQEWSGLMTPANKALILDRIEELTRAIRAARSRANEAEVDRTKKIGNQLLSYIFG